MRSSSSGSSTSAERGAPLVREPATSESTRDRASEGLGVYIHVPFCATRCDYCAFTLWTDKADRMEAYVAAVCAEIATAQEAELLGAARTVYIGGGTPSLLGPELLGRLLDALELAPGAEVSVECNPGSTSAPLLAALRESGVTRISLGVQSLNRAVLESLGRDESPEMCRAALELVASAGFRSFSVDLVYGAVAERDEDLLATLFEVLGYQPGHLSCYALTVEAGTALGRDPARHPDDDRLAARYALVDEMLSDAGYAWYEVSNFARPGHRCRHNLGYWEERDYLGFGCAAHSHLGDRRFSNVVHIERYLDRIAQGRSPVAREEHLTPDEQAFEALVLSLRTSRGVPLAALDIAPIEHLVTVGDGRAVLTRAGRMLADEVALRLRPF
jgi:oxygen-independent coproporphyrinogen-3 oxidase